MEPFEALCHTFWMSLIEQSTQQDNFQLALITPLAFIAEEPDLQLSEAEQVIREQDEAKLAHSALEEAIAESSTRFKQ
ncbi:hypothetical protein B5807_04036 [Epicoccum nigrum]|uniref:Uncharacterized protein n=1 Tax=Epicoccum nigrum TaxID=105696 RepID=A0A1Y2M8S4_EPING|nr:hypothetical protein B5807_04036 [Epicoccum nigrum]